MAVTFEQVRAQLTPVEPNYVVAARLGIEALPHLEQIAAGKDLVIAPRAVYLAGLIGGASASKILLEAAASSFVALRIQAVANIKNLPREIAAEILMKSLSDRDPGVRKYALKSVKNFYTKILLPGIIQEKITAISNSDESQFLKESSIEILKIAQS